MSSLWPVRSRGTPPRAERASCTGFELAQARHAALYLLRRGERGAAREQLARCVQLLHLAYPRSSEPRWPGEVAAMRGA